MRNQVNPPARTLLVVAFSCFWLCGMIRPLTGSEAIPRVTELAGQWQDASTLRSLPALNNEHGSAQVMNDVLAVGNASFPPVTIAGDTGCLLINGVAPKLEQTLWAPYEVRRRAHAGDVGIETTVRMPCAENGFLFRIRLTNSAAAQRTFDLRINLTAKSSRHGHWGWSVPRNLGTNQFAAIITDDGHSLLVMNAAAGKPANCFSFTQAPDALTIAGDSGTAVWHVSLPAYQNREIDYALAVGTTNFDGHVAALQWAGNFDTTFDNVERGWQSRFDDMFTPGNHRFSGHLPTLITTDEKMRRTYYLSAVSLLSVYRTCFPQAPRVYVSNTPEYDCIMMYFWDTREWATTLALLDPVMLKQYLRDWLARGIHHGYAEEFLTGTLQGPWYSANDYSIFMLLDSYLNVTGDRAFLSEKIGDKTVLEHMDGIATNWKQLVRPGRTLADYGEAGNLLECVPTYIHEVPSFNAANVWMMRRVAAIHEAEGNPEQAKELRAEADHLVAAVLALYEHGQGVWDSLHRDGSRVQMRHVFDFATIGLTIKDDLSPTTRREMSDFVERELLTDHWMRAQSLRDPAAEKSDRPDHGPMGAFSAWPAETMASLCEFGEYNRALDFLHRCASVTEEGPYSQSRELLGRTPDAIVRIASRGQQTYNASNGGAFAETIIREFFGYQPDFLSKNSIPNPSPRGFKGQLLNVEQAGQSFDITSRKNGLRVIRSAGL